MKRFLSALLCAMLLLGLLPVVSTPALMLTNLTCSVNKTIAYVGDTITWTVHFDNPAGEYNYQFDIMTIGSTYLDDNDWHSENYRNFRPPEPNYYYTDGKVWEKGTSSSYSFFGTAITVSLRPATTITKIEALSGTSLKLTWNKIPGATGYEVWRRTGSVGEYKLIKTTTALSYSNTYLTAGTRYYYQIRAYNLCDGLAGPENRPSSGFSAAKSGVPLAKPTITGAIGVSSSQIKLTWTKVPGATGYQILRSTSAAGTYQSIKLTTALTYTVGGMQSDKTYYFKVRPYKKIYTATYYGPLSAYKAGKTK